MKNSSCLIRSYFSALALLVLLACSFTPNQAQAASIIRDAEIETLLKRLSAPLIEAAGLNTRDVKLYIINDPNINAFVAGGQNIFIHTGLLQQSEDPELLLGVIAHEIGHISGGHLVSNQGAFSDTALKTAFGYALGIAAAAAGSPEAGQAIAAGTTHVAQRQYLKFTRTQEEAADQSALSYLNATGYTARGLMTLLETLFKQEQNHFGDSLNPYTLTHPLSRERIRHIRSIVDQKDYPGKDLPSSISDDFARAIVKLKAFLFPPQATLSSYQEEDQSTNARYARAIAYFRTPNLAQALHEINNLLADHPRDPFFHELKGQIYYENGKAQEAMPSYEEALRLKSDSPLLMIELANVQIATNDPSLLKKAQINLEHALALEPNNVFAWHQLGIAYGRQGLLGLSNLALAEEALRRGLKKDVEKFIGLATPHIKTGSKEERQKLDIEKAAEDLK